MTPRDAAQTLIAAGLSVIPIKTDASKASLIPWKEFQDRAMTPDEVERYFSGSCGIAALGGFNQLEIIDIEAEAPQSDLATLIDEHLPGILATLPQVITPTGGRHIFYRCTEIAGNQKLAMSAASKVLIETRGQGGYVLTVTSPPECHPSGKTYKLAVGSLTKIPTITAEQRDILLSCCRSFNQLSRPADEHRPSKVGDGLRPGDDFNQHGNGLQALLDHGWKVVGRPNGCTYLCRPGKKTGISASFGKVAPNVLYVFSSNAQPFDFERAYDAFGIYARLEAGGDFERATKLLAGLGFGKPAVAPSPERASDEDVALATMNVNEDNVARKFEDDFKDELRYCEAWGRWLEWDGSRWKIERTLKAFDYCRRIARKMNFAGKVTPAKSSFARGVESFARASRTFATVSEQWDKNWWLFNTPAGTVNLETGNLSSHVRTDSLTKCANIAPVDGKRPIFDRFLRDITLEDGGLVEYLQRALGSCLSGAVQDNFLLFWYGDKGQNGKNTLSELIAWILGDYADFIPTETLMATKNAQHLTFLASLRGLRLAICSEVAEGSYWNEQRIKSLTGDGKIAANYMRQDPFSFDRTHKHIVLGNHRPMLRVVDPAIRVRLHIIPFRAHFDEETKDPQMGEKLRAEAPQILQWLIDGHSRWMEDGRILKKCSAVQAETDSYFEAQSTNEVWVAECCSLLEGNESFRCKAGELYKNFKTFKESRGEGVISQTRWGEWMSQRFRKVKDSSVYYIGIQLKDPTPTASNAYRRDYEG